MTQWTRSESWLYLCSKIRVQSDLIPSIGTAVTNCVQAVTIPVQDGIEFVTDGTLFRARWNYEACNLYFSSGIYNTQLRLHEGATAVLQKHGIKITRNLSADRFQKQLQALQDQRDQLQKTQKSADQAAREADEKLQILKQYLASEDLYATIKFTKTPSNPKLE